MGAIKAAFEAGTITKEQAIAKFEFVKEECAEEFKDVFEKCAPNGPHGPPHGPRPHMMDLVAVFKNVFGAGPDAAKSPECDAAIEDMKASCAPKDWATFDWSKCAAASKALADKCAKVPPGADANGNLEAKPSGNPDCDAAIADMSDACAKSDDPAAVYDWKKCSDASKKIAKACSKWGPKEPADVSALEAKPSGNPDCDAAIADMDAACAASDDPAAVYDWSKCAKASKKIAKACSKWGPKEPADVSALEAKPSGNPDCDAAIADMDAACAKSDDPAAVYDWSKCAKASKKIAKACSKWGPKKPEEEPEKNLEASAKPEDAKCDAALEKMRDACAAPAKDAKDASPYDWKKCADASKALAAACAKPGPKPDSPFNFLACVAQAKLTESECAYDVQSELAKEDRFDAYIDAFEKCEPSVDQLVQACQ
jgi:hypothetical protein